jgi:hypothetical protein
LLQQFWRLLPVLQAQSEPKATTQSVQLAVKTTNAKRFAINLRGKADAATGMLTRATTDSEDIAVQRVPHLFLQGNIMRLLNIYASEDDILFLIEAAKSHAEKIVKHLESELIFAKSAQNETFLQKKERLPEVKIKPTTVFAPHGLKKDGTPSKRRGRPAIKKAKKVTA